VLQAFGELNIPVDCYGGTSMGAGLAAAGAMQISQEEIRMNMRRAFIDSKVTRAWTVPIVSLLDTRRMDEALVALGDGRDIADLWVPYFAVATNITAMSIDVIERGPLWVATRASSSMPMVFPPVFRDGEVLLDGGLLDNLPVGPMRERCPRLVIAVDVIKPPKTQVSRELTKPPSGWTVLWQRLTRRRRARVRVPQLLDVATYSLLCASVIEARRSHDAADLVLHPDVAAFGTLDFAAVDQIIERGYQYTMEQREKLLALTGFARSPLEGARDAEHPLLQ
jgi:predicted acylesterase/phospholipase RssA